MKEKEKPEDRLPVLPLPVVESEATRVILSYRQNLLNDRPSEKTLLNNASEIKDILFKQTFAPNDEVTKDSRHWTTVGLTSFDDEFDPQLTERWLRLEEEAYESINITPVSPYFRPHVPCLSSKTNNSVKPLCVVKGEFYKRC